ncbi:MAG TPA: polysaccharide biosynthesis tyrosine autokinase [Gemmatimonadaceae bacterium]|nr:polysaccharide biosynthesis tyrosine autokinase [Gemmatimonadaceae bacterium]
MTASRDSENLPAPRRPMRVATASVSPPMLDPSLTYAEAESQQEENLSLRQIVDAIKRHRLLVTAITFAVFAAVAVWTWRAPRVYQSTASVRIDDKEKSGSPLKDVIPMPNFGNGKVMTEMEVLRSRQLAENVARKLQLNLEVVEPAAGSQLIKAVSLPDDIPAGEFTLRRKDARSYSLLSNDDTKLAAPQVVHVGEPFALGPARLVLQQPPYRSLPENIKFRFQSLRDATAAMMQKRTVTRPNREAEIVNVQYQSTDPALAAQVPNLLLEEFIRYKSQSSKTKASSTVGFLRDQVATYQGQLKNAESALGTFRQDQQVVSLEDEASAQVKRMAELQVERDRLTAERNAIASILAKPAASGESHARDVAAFPSFIANRGIQDILAALLQLETERNALLVKRNPENADVVALTNRIDSLNAQLMQMSKGYVAGLDSKIAALTTNISSFGKQIESIPTREIQYARLARDEKLLEEMSTLLNRRLKEAEIEEAVEPGDAQLIDRALIPENPTSPKVALNLVLGLVVGLGLGLLTGVGRDLLDTKIHTKEDLQAVTGGIPVLAGIPRFNLKPSKFGGLKRSTDSRDTKQIAPGAGLITLVESRNASVEAYRALRTNITFAGADVRLQVLVLTSGSPGDGKSTTAANLALTLAQQGVRTLLVDADLRKGVLHKLFSVRREPGLTQVLIGKAGLAEAVQVIPAAEGGVPLSVLTAGPYPPNPAELLGSARMRSLIAEMREQYDTIVIDSPPLGLVTDAAILGTLADTTMLVARAGVTEKKAMQHAATQLYNLRVPVGGTILNDFNPKQAGYGYEYGYSSSYGEGL